MTEIRYHLLGALLGAVITTLSVVILTFQNMVLMFAGGALLGVGLACLNNSLSQSWKRFEKGAKWGPFSWQALRHSMVIGLSTGLLTTFFSSIRVQLTTDLGDIAIAASVIVFEFLGAGISGLVARLIILKQLGRTQICTRHLWVTLGYSVAISVGAVTLGLTFGLGYKYVFGASKSVATSESGQNAFLMVLFSGIYASLNAIGSAFCVTIAMNRWTMRRREVVRADLLDYIGDEVEGQKIWDGLVKAGLMLVKVDVSTEEGLKAASLKNSGKLSPSYTTDQYPPISPNFDSAAKSYLAKYNDTTYNLKKNVLISSFIGFLLGGLIGFAQYRYAAAE